MVKVIGVRFRLGGRVYYFDPLEYEIERGQHVIVETARGIEYGFVVSGVKEVSEEELVSPLKPVIRIATPEDDKTHEYNLSRKKKACEVCQEKIDKHELDMKLVDAEYTFDSNKLLFYFTSDGRVDFRELVKDLAAEFRTRIELRQIGVRDEIKMKGGLGVCGREICCHSYLSDFVPVSIKMAKDQNLSLNPTKISGVCGRLMCCLKNEVEAYEELNKSMPGVGDFVTAVDGVRGEVISINVLRQTVRVLVEKGDEREVKEYNASVLQFKKMYHKNNANEMTDEEREALAELEREELADKLEKQENEKNKQRIKEEREARINKSDKTDKDNKPAENKHSENKQKENKHSDSRHGGPNKKHGEHRDNFNPNRKRSNPNPNNAGNQNNRNNNDANKSNVANNRNSRHGRAHRKEGKNGNDGQNNS